MYYPPPQILLEVQWFLKSKDSKKKPHMQKKFHAICVCMEPYSEIYCYYSSVASATTHTGTSAFTSRWNLTVHTYSPTTLIGFLSEMSLRSIL